MVSKFSGLELHEVRVNHRQLLNAIWAWAGVKHNERHNIAQVNNFKFEKKSMSSDWGTFTLRFSVNMTKFIISLLKRQYATHYIF